MYITPKENDGLAVVDSVTSKDYYSWRRWLPSYIVPHMRFTQELPAGQPRENSKETDHGDKG